MQANTATTPVPDGYRLVRVPVGHREGPEPAVIGVVTDGVAETVFTPELAALPKVQVRHITPQGGEVSEQLKGVHALLVPHNPALLAAAQAAASGLPAPFGIALLQAALMEGMPIRGLGDGHLLLNLAAGGTVAPSPQNGINHTQGSHVVVILNGTQTETRLGLQSGFTVDSDHGQVVDRAAPGFHASVLAADGTIEAIEKPNSGGILGMQFTPQSARPRFNSTLADDAFHYWDRKEPLYTERLEEIPKQREWTSPQKAKDEHMKIGLRELEAEGLEVWGSNGSRVTEKSLKKNGLWGKDAPDEYYLRNKGSQDNLLVIPKYKLDDVLLTFSPGGVKELWDEPREVIERTRELDRGGATWFRSSGFWGRTRTPLTFDIERYWAYNEGRLVMQLPPRTEGGQPSWHAIKDLPSLRKWEVAKAPPPPPPPAEPPAEDPPK